MFGRQKGSVKCPQKGANVPKKRGRQVLHKHQINIFEQIILRTKLRARFVATGKQVTQIEMRQTPAEAYHILDFRFGLK